MIPRKIREALHHILHLDETPHVLAKSLAVGVFVAFTPFMGLHTVLVLILAWALRLNKAVALTGTFVNNPWTIAFIFVGPTWATVAAMRSMGVDMPPFNYDVVTGHFMNAMEQYKIWQPVFWKTFLMEFKPYLHAFLIGTALAGLAAAFVSYGVSFLGIHYYRMEKAKLKKKKAEV